MPFYPAADDDVQRAQVPGAVACRCCPGGISRSRRTCRYPSDMTGAEWAVCEPLLPAPAWLAGRGGRPASWCMRDVVDAIRYLTHNGPVWRALPATPCPLLAGSANWGPQALKGQCHGIFGRQCRPFLLGAEAVFGQGAASGSPGRGD